VVPWRASSLFDEKWIASDVPVVTLQSCMQTNAFRVFPRVHETLYRYLVRPVRQPGNRRMTPIGSEATIPAFARKT